MCLRRDKLQFSSYLLIYKFYKINRNLCVPHPSPQSLTSSSIFIITAATRSPQGSHACRFTSHVCSPHPPQKVAGEALCLVNMNRSKYKLKLSSKVLRRGTSSDDLLHRSPQGTIENPPSPVTAVRGSGQRLTHINAS